MALAESIMQILAGVIGLLAAWGIDKMVGKWLAYFVIAWEEKATKEAHAAFSETLAAVKKDMPKKYAAWEEWRKRAQEAPPRTP